MNRDLLTIHYPQVVNNHALLPTYAYLNFAPVETKKQDIRPGSQVEEALYGFKGIVRCIFPNFWDICSTCIDDKEHWLACQVVPVDLEERMEPWAIIDTIEGDQIASPFSRLEQLSHKTMDVTGLFVRNSDVKYDAMGMLVRPFSYYTLFFKPGTNCFVVMPQIHWN